MNVKYNDLRLVRASFEQHLSGEQLESLRQCMNRVSLLFNSTLVLCALVDYRANRVPTETQANELIEELNIDVGDTPFLTWARLMVSRHAYVDQ